MMEWNSNFHCTTHNYPSKCLSIPSTTKTFIDFTSRVNR